MITSRAPVRISMGGGGTDLPSYYRKFGGFLMAATIDKFVYVMANRRFYDSIRLSYSKTEIVDNADLVEHAIFREVLKSYKIRCGIELVSIADVPAQCGLGTSSAFTVALINALEAYRKRRISPGLLAETACRIEIDVLRQPIGKQDQYAAAFGGFRAFWFNPDGSVRTEKVRISPRRLRNLEDRLLLFHVIKERSATSVLALQDAKTRAGDAETLNRLHAIKELGIRTKRIFERGNLDEFGEILHEHWTVKRGLSRRVSDEAIDGHYRAARKKGAVGGKLVGAGGGGFFLFYCRARKTRAVVDALAERGLSPTPFRFHSRGAETLLAGRAGTR